MNVLGSAVALHDVDDQEHFAHGARPAGGTSVIDSSPYEDRLQPARKSQVSASATMMPPSEPPT
jgi:hypothetical protein